MLFCKKCIQCPVRFFIEQHVYNDYIDYHRELTVPYFFACGAVYSPIQYPKGTYTEVISQPNCYKDLVDSTVSFKGVRDF